MYMNTQYIAGTLSASLGPENYCKLYWIFEIFQGKPELEADVPVSPRQILLPTGPLVFSYAMSLYQDAVIQHKSSSF